MTMSSHTPPPSPCVDFVVVGEADCTGGLSFADISSSLLNHNPTRAQVRPVVMTSNNAKAQDFYLRHATGTLCSAALTSRDIAWMERTSGLKTGALFKAFKQATAAGAPTARPSLPEQVDTTMITNHGDAYDKDNYKSLLSYRRSPSCPGSLRSGGASCRARCAAHNVARRARPTWRTFGGATR